MTFPPTRYRITRTLTSEECWWLSETVNEGEVVYEYLGYTYGAISPAGIPVSRVPDEIPFFEVPRDAVEVVE